MRRIAAVVLCSIVVLTSQSFGIQDALQKKVFIEPDQGFETYIAAAFSKKKTPVAVVSDVEDAEFVLKATPVDSKPESTGSKVARCLLAYCAGINGTQSVSVQLIDTKTKVTVWGYTVRKGDANGYQSSAEAIAKHLKNFLAEKSTEKVAK
jgi:hypothetical protein